MENDQFLKMLLYKFAVSVFAIERLDLDNYNYLSINYLLSCITIGCFALV